MPIDIAVIPVAGLGTRLLPATKSQPKEMLPVGRRPVVQYVVEELARVGVKRCCSSPAPARPPSRTTSTSTRNWSRRCARRARRTCSTELAFDRAAVQYFFTRQRQLLGLGHAVLCSRAFVGRQPFVVALGDSIIGMHAQSDVVQRMTRCFTEKGAAAVIAFEEVPEDEVHQYGIAAPRGAG